MYIYIYVYICIYIYTQNIIDIPLTEPVPLVKRLGSLVTPPRAPRSRQGTWSLAFAKEEGCSSFLAAAGMNGVFQRPVNGKDELNMTYWYLMRSVHLSWYVALSPGRIAGYDRPYRCYLLVVATDSCASGVPFYQNITLQWAPARVSQWLTGHGDVSPFGIPGILGIL